MSRRAQLAACALALSLAACGGEGRSSESEATNRPPAPPIERSSTGHDSEPTPAPSSHEGEVPPKPAGDRDGGSASLGPLRVSGGGSAEFRVEGGDNSVQEYGAEADSGGLSEAAAVVHSFYVARIAGEWGRACEMLSADERESLAGVAPGAGGDCAEGLAAYTADVSPSVARAITTVDAASLRREDDQGFLIYTGPPGRTVYAMPLVNEGGAWRLGAIAGAIMPGT